MNCVQFERMKERTEPKRTHQSIDAGAAALGSSIFCLPCLPKQSSSCVRSFCSSLPLGIELVNLCAVPACVCDCMTHKPQKPYKPPHTVGCQSVRTAAEGKAGGRHVLGRRGGTGFLPKRYSSKRCTTHRMHHATPRRGRRGARRGERRGGVSE